MFKFCLLVFTWCPLHENSLCCPFITSAFFGTYVIHPSKFMIQNKRAFFIPSLSLLGQNWRGAEAQAWVSVEKSLPHIIMVSVSMFLLTLKCHSPSLVTQILTLLFQPVLPTEILEFLHSYSAPPTHTDPSPHSPPSILTPYDRLPTLTAVPEPNCCFLKLASLWVTSSSIADSVSQ